MYSTVLIFCLSFLISVTVQETVNVTLYYESLCPYSQEFIRDQLEPGYAVLGDLLQIELVPFGKAKLKSKKLAFTCQHGPKECTGNKIQACALSKDFTQKQKMSFVGCVMKEDHPEKKEVVKTCAEKYDIPFKTLKQCYKGEEGNKLLLHYKEITDALQPKLKYVPTIVINGVYDADKDNSARENFLKTVCESFTEKPSACPT